MSAYILAITGVVLLSIVIDGILPNGHTAKYIKSIMALIIVFVIVAPLPALVRKVQSGAFWQKETNSDSDWVNQNFVYSVNADKLAAGKKEAEKNIAAAGYLNTELYITADLFMPELKVLHISVSLLHLKVTNGASVDKAEETIKALLASQFNINKEAIYFYGR